MILSDDGLQHYRLARDVEIAVIDGVRRHGNGRCLPAGPLREPVSRLRTVDLVVGNGAAARGEFGMALVPWKAVNLRDEGCRRVLQRFQGRVVHAVCGIGNAERFFSMLERAGLHISRHPFPDHHDYVAADLDLGDDSPVLMTEKDAVKCVRHARANHWYVPVRAELQSEFAVRLMRLLGSPVVLASGDGAPLPS